MDYKYSKTFNITNNLKVTVYDWQTNAKLVFENGSRSQFIHLDVDSWTEFKKAFFEIDEEYRKRFNYQYSNV